MAWHGMAAFCADCATLSFLDRGHAGIHHQSKSDSDDHIGVAGSEPKDAVSTSSSRTSSQAVESPAVVGERPEDELVQHTSLPASIGLNKQTTSILEVLQQLEALNR